MNSTNTNLYWDMEMNLTNCPQLSLELFGEEIELAILDFQKWGPDESVGIFSGDLEVTKMAWRPAGTINLYGTGENYACLLKQCKATHDAMWQCVHSSAVELIRRAYYSELMEAIEAWEKERML